MQKFKRFSHEAVLGLFYRYLATPICTINGSSTHALEGVCDFYSFAFVHTLTAVVNYVYLIFFHFRLSLFVCNCSVDILHYAVKLFKSLRTIKQNSFIKFLKSTFLEA